MPSSPTSSAAAPTIKPHQKVAEFTLKAALLGVLLAVLLAVANTFLALKIGVLTASSIPAAMLSMAVLRLFPSHSILENNLVQTCASAGEAIAGGIVYTAPGLIIIHAWHHFPYGQTFLLTWIGGVLGVLLTVPVRRSLMQNKALRFPEAQAISQVLIAGTVKQIRITQLLIAAICGGVFELAQTGLKLFANQATLWLSRGQAVFNIGLGFSATLLGAGYLTGYRVAGSIFLGTIISHLLLLPVLSSYLAPSLSTASLHTAGGLANKAIYGQAILDHHVRYIGIGAMLAAGILTLVYMLKPFALSFYSLLRTKSQSHAGLRQLKQISCVRTERNLPPLIIILGCCVCWFICGALFYHMFYHQIHEASVSYGAIITLVLGAVLFIIVFGFIFSIICAYFSGLVGVTASPGSSVAIATILLAAALMGLLAGILSIALHHMVAMLMVFTMMITCIVMGSACVANNNSQDLKVGHIIGATPWKQQVMLLLGVTVASLVVPYVMQLLFQTYGIAGVGAHGPLSAQSTLAAPPAAAMAAIAQAAFSHQLPVHDLWYGVVIIALAYGLQLLFSSSLKGLSLIGIAIGIYLPLSSATALCLGGLIDYMIKRKQSYKPAKANSDQSHTHHQALLVACGLVAGAAITNVLLAIPFSLLKHGYHYAMIAPSHYILSQVLAALAMAALAYYLYGQARRD